MVYFVGAGTGAVDLITVRGMRLLETADVIIYAGSLVNPEILAYAKKKCAIYNSAELTLDEIIQIMRNAEYSYKTTVRLHTGDPSIYGAVREQMDELDKLGISYESCPGVSACFGAAASLNIEYTLPGLSQSLIITRMAGKTEVPEAESIESFAAHKSSMAIYLSAGMIGELAKRLINGGYGEETPATIVYKATWREEEAYICTVGTLCDTASAHGIKNTAIVLVGEAVAHQNYKKSRLYSADFSTSFRDARDKAPAEPALRHEVENLGFKASGDFVKNPYMELSIISFTPNGRELSKNLAAAVNAENNGFKAVSYETGTEASVSEWAKAMMSEKNALLFIGACGIAVRAVSPHISDKLHDSPVLVMDEKGKYVIPVMSAHIGGANKLARHIAEKVGAEVVITTATDINKKFAIDLFAKENGLHIVNREGIAKVSAKVLSGGKITISVEGERVINKGFMPKEVELAPYPPPFPVDVAATSENAEFDAVLLLKPKEYVIGFGCKKGKSLQEIEAFIMKRLKTLDISLSNIYALSSIAQKSNEKGIVEWCKKENIVFVTYDAEELQKTEGVFNASLFVKDTVGVDNVCERAAVKACGDSGKIVAEKYAEAGMTIAVAKRKWSVRFDER